MMETTRKIRLMPDTLLFPSNIMLVQFHGSEASNYAGEGGDIFASGHHPNAFRQPNVLELVPDDGQNFAERMAKDDSPIAKRTQAMVERGLNEDDRLYAEPLTTEQRLKISADHTVLGRAVQLHGEKPRTPHLAVVEIEVSEGVYRRSMIAEVAQGFEWTMSLFKRSLSACFPGGTYVRVYSRKIVADGSPAAEIYDQESLNERQIIAEEILPGEDTRIAVAWKDSAPTAYLRLILREQMLPDELPVLGVAPNMELADGSFRVRTTPHAEVTVNYFVQGTGEIDQENPPDDTEFYTDGLKMWFDVLGTGTYIRGLATPGEGCTIASAIIGNLFQTPFPHAPLLRFIITRLFGGYPLFVLTLGIAADANNGQAVAGANFAVLNGHCTGFLPPCDALKVTPAPPSLHAEVQKQLSALAARKDRANTNTNGSRGRGIVPSAGGSYSD